MPELDSSDCTRACQKQNETSLEGIPLNFIQLDLFLFLSLSLSLSLSHSLSLFLATRKRPQTQLAALAPSPLNIKLVKCIFPEFSVSTKIATNIFFQKSRKKKKKIAAGGSQTEQQPQTNKSRFRDKVQ
jgi:hypothetical protein